MMIWIGIIIIILSIIVLVYEIIDFRLYLKRHKRLQKLFDEHSKATKDLIEEIDNERRKKR